MNCFFFFAHHLHNTDSGMLQWQLRQLTSCLDVNCPMPQATAIMSMLIRLYAFREQLNDLACLRYKAGGHPGGVEETRHTLDRLDTLHCTTWPLGLSLQKTRWTLWKTRTISIWSQEPHWHDGCKWKYVFINTVADRAVSVPIDVRIWHLYQRQLLPGIKITSCLLLHLDVLYHLFVVILMFFVCICCVWVNRIDYNHYNQPPSFYFAV